MAKTTTVNIRMDAELKREAEALFADLGFNMSTAVNIFVRQALKYNGLPFDVTAKTPNAETLAAMEDVVAGRNLSGPFRSVKDLMESLEQDDDV